jgi:2-keto-4-pentenoate hydratase/2-oxohepta-3-ene-1,7-dioic acid hydratase in catechol pathway
MSTKFSLGTFSIAGSQPFAGVVLSEDKTEQVIPAVALGPLCEQAGRPLRSPQTVLGLLEDWEYNLAALQAGIAQFEAEARKIGKPSVETLSLQAVTFHAPLLYPRQIICAGANYRQHVIDLVADQGGGPLTEHMSREERRAWAANQMDQRIAEGTPYVFSQLPSTITGPFDPVILPRSTREADWELELGVIIGKAARHVSRENALDYVAGYTIVNDLTSRDKIFRKDLKAMGTDWLAGKCSPSFLPTGPYFVPALFVPDPQQLQITLKLNGEIMQNESTADMMFDIARLIEYISGHVQLWPGDLISTGSPAGNGTHYNRYLQAGDVLEGSISGLGMQRNICVAE